MSEGKGGTFSASIAASESWIERISAQKIEEKDPLKKKFFRADAGEKERQKRSYPGKEEGSCGDGGLKKDVRMAVSRKSLRKRKKKKVLSLLHRKKGVIAPKGPLRREGMSSRKIRCSRAKGHGRSRINLPGEKEHP